MKYQNLIYNDLAIKAYDNANGYNKLNISLIGNPRNLSPTSTQDLPTLMIINY